MQLREDHQFGARAGPEDLDDLVGEGGHGLADEAGGGLRCDQGKRAVHVGSDLLGLRTPVILDLNDPLREEV